MKMLRMLVYLVCLSLVASVCLGAETAVTVAPPPTLFAWFQANTTVILGAALAISELLARIPSFKGNGIIDTIIKALAVLSEKTPPKQP